MFKLIKFASVSMNAYPVSTYLHLYIYKYFYPEIDQNVYEKIVMPSDIIFPRSFNGYVAQGTLHFIK